MTEIQHDTLFPFLCPQGHLLHGEPEQVGSLCACPLCGAQMIVPSPAAEHGTSEHGTAASQLGNQEPNPESPTAAVVERQTAPTSLSVSQEPAEPELFHIPCPKGHELETPREMLEKFAKCPLCGEKFRLRRTKSLEYLQQKERDEELRLKRQERFWTKFAIGLLTVCIVIVLVLIGLSTLGNVTN